MGDRPGGAIEELDPDAEPRRRRRPTRFATADPDTTPAVETSVSPVSGSSGTPAFASGLDATPAIPEISPPPAATPPAPPPVPAGPPPPPVDVPPGSIVLQPGQATTVTLTGGQRLDLINKSDQVRVEDMKGLEGIAAGLWLGLHGDEKHREAFKDTAAQWQAQGWAIEVL
ncbi:MAG: hypothetical protein Q8Q14_07325, partial [Gemmatimonadales bacterium]|nr:hypothetical protein [Gemmatimonadales bacterium]